MIGAEHYEPKISHPTLKQTSAILPFMRIYIHAKSFFVLVYFFEGLFTSKKVAEGVGFEPTVLAYNGFQVRRALSQNMDLRSKQYYHVYK
jgi:hypothetical protein